MKKQDSDDSLSYKSSIMNVKIADMAAAPTMAVAKQSEKGNVFFWFKRSDFYVTGMDFVFSRIALMSQSTAITFYLKLVCGYKGATEEDTPWQLAFAPAVSFLASLVWSLSIQEKLQSYHCYSKYNLFLYTIVLFTPAAFFFYLMVENDPFWTPLLLYPALILQGCGLANMLNTSTSLVSEMIGQDDEASAIVFASLNIVESFANGGVVFIIMSYSLNDSPAHLKFVIGVMPVLSATGAYIISYLRFHNKSV